MVERSEVVLQTGKIKSIKWYASGRKSCPGNFGQKLIRHLSWESRITSYLKGVSGHRSSSTNRGTQGIDPEEVDLIKDLRGTELIKGWKTVRLESGY